MKGGVAVLLFPGEAAVCRGDDSSERADSPAMQGTVGSERHREEMISDTRGSTNPTHAAVNRREHQAAGAGDYGARSIFYVKPIQRRVGV